MSLEGVDPAYANLMVKCPAPGQQHLAAMTLGEFMQTEQGRQYGQTAIETAEYLVETGMDEDQALIRGFAGSLLLDEEGRVARAEPEPALHTPELATAELDSKKK